MSIASIFVQARRDARIVREYPGPAPTTLAQAYAVQDEAVRRISEPVGGWKVGRINPPLDRELGSNRLAGPVIARTIRDGRSAAPAMPVFAGFAAAETEFLMRVGRSPDPERTQWCFDDALSHIDGVHIGMEIASSPFPGINDNGPFVTISDFGNNHGLVIGEAVDEWRDRRFVDWPVRLEIDGTEVGSATAAAMLDGPVGAVAWLFGALAERGVAIAPGQWISTGAVTGVHRVAPGARVVARFGDLAVACSIEAAKPART